MAYYRLQNIDWRCFSNAHEASRRDQAVATSCAPALGTFRYVSARTAFTLQLHSESGIFSREEKDLCECGFHEDV